MVISTRKGGQKKSGPKHQNTYGFKHNANSKRTKYIMKRSAGAEVGLCPRCTQQIDWKKKYRKYKPIKAPRRCNTCHEKNVKFAYHIHCKKCCMKRKICAKCSTPYDYKKATKIYECEYDCGFEGLFDEVAAHEKICPSCPTVGNSTSSLSTMSVYTTSESVAMDMER